MKINYIIFYSIFLIEDKAKFSKLLDTTKKDIEVFGFGNDNKDSVSQGSVESYGFPIECIAIPILNNTKIDVIKIKDAEKKNF